MKATATNVLAGLLEPLGRCMTAESAKEILSLCADERLRQRVEELADKSDGGALSPDERAEYQLLVDLGDWVALFQAQARRFLAEPPGR